MPGWGGRSKDLVDDSAFNQSQALLPTFVQPGEFILIESQLVQNRCVDVPKMAAITDSVHADIVGAQRSGEQRRQRCVA